MENEPNTWRAMPAPEARQTPYPAVLAWLAPLYYNRSAGHTSHAANLTYPSRSRDPYSHACVEKRTPVGVPDPTFLECGESLGHDSVHPDPG